MPVELGTREIIMLILVIIALAIIIFLSIKYWGRMGEGLGSLFSFWKKVKV